ncbi:diacylglycerol/lipid kinase family protein [Ornithinimicrobium flavum]|uniref:diacylglycerol/lipid kinase family protein n=1 Tax=Ornithinimicrobium flavum TaxID=1288636 RepID=UPI00106FD6B7|nr:diacylglycerol kinase family protein [Ornithinimicrobium flavum]
MSWPRVALVLNPVARGSDRARQVVERQCAVAGLGPPLVLPTTVEDPGEGQARQALDAGVQRVVVAGGDGTVRLVAGALAGPPAGGAATAGAGLGTPSERPVFGVVPVGTANLYARTLGLPRRDLTAAVRLAVTGPGRPMDLGTVSLVSGGGTTTRQPFLVVVGLGHDAHVVADLDPALKRRLRALAYFAPGLRRLSSAGRPVTLRLDHHLERTESVWSILAVNAARLPLGARVVPGARPDDGLLHVVLVAPRHLLDWVHVARTGLGGRSGPHPALRHESGQELTVRPAEPALVQVDGDLLADIVRARISIEPGALLVAAP